MVITSHSWTVYDKDIAVKLTDKSIFAYGMSDIPVDIRSFFNISDLSKGQTKQITIIFRDGHFDAKLKRINTPSGQTNIIWKRDFTSLINDIYPNVIENGNYPEIRFEKINDSSYSVSFLDSADDRYKNSLDSDLLESIIPLPGNKEGRKIQYYTTKYERNPINRREAIRIHGTRCMACGFDFKEFYGEIGSDFIEVHHVKPLYSLDEEIEIDPNSDLVCLCSNCHRMIHRDKNSVLSLDDLISRINQRKV